MPSCLVQKEKRKKITTKHEVFRIIIPKVFSVSMFNTHVGARRYS